MTGCFVCFRVHCVVVLQGFVCLCPLFICVAELCMCCSSGMRTDSVTQCFIRLCCRVLCVFALQGRGDR